MTRPLADIPALFDDHAAQIDALACWATAPADLTDAALAAAHSYHRVRAHQLRREMAIREVRG